MIERYSLSHTYLVLLLLFIVTLAVCSCADGKADSVSDGPHPVTSAYRFECQRLKNTGTPYRTNVFRCRDFKPNKCYIMIESYRGGAQLRETDCIVLEGEYDYWMRRSIERAKRRAN